MYLQSDTYYDSVILNSTIVMYVDKHFVDRVL